MPHFSLLAPGRRPNPVGPPAFDFPVTRHAIARMQQRAISWQDVTLVLHYGREYHAGDGRTAYHLGRQIVAGARRKGIRLDRASNLSILVGRDGTLITVQHTEFVPRSWRSA